ncbi:hypothetical protein J2T57_001579 [Natronocella acetinitrilica]|uniref:Tetratricopeptide repeat protein n=1 Tax=Natronocella acetinitrilica TaxID=414046 RepID=A0AAE3G2Z5_9GAMM|nr:hypothetical protein [Natronocella acetinitrilica]MCP1674477.1 hypothetical protein [Natronocella acetinitrilica]
MSVKTWGVCALLLAAGLASAGTSELVIELSIEGVDGPAALERERALRHYARSGERERLAVEIRRLQAADPDWQVPRDLFSQAETDADTTPVWRAIAAGDFDAAERALAGLRSAHPHFTPGEELATALRVEPAAAALLVASKAGDDNAVVAAAKATPEVLGCERLDLRWRTAESLSRLERFEAARANHAETLARCPGADVARATLEKHRAEQGEVAMRALARAHLEKHAPDRPTVEAIEALLAEQGDAGSGLDARFAGADRPLGEALEADFAAEIMEERSRAKANILAWHYYRRGEHANAAEWFERSRAWGVNANAIQGLARVAIATGEPARGEAIARPWRGQWQSVRAAHEDALVALLGQSAEAGDALTHAQREAARAAAGQSRAVTLALAWHELEQGAAAHAQRLFSAALANKADVEAAEGLALAHRALGEERRVEAVVAEYAPRSAAHDAALTPLLGADGGHGQRAAQALEAGEHASCLREVRAGLADGERPGLLLLGGWCEKAAGRAEVAEDYFTRALGAGAEGEERADAGLGLALVAAERDGASAGLRVAARHGVRDAHLAPLREIERAERAVAAFEARDYQRANSLLAELPANRERDLMRAWSLHHLGQRRDAHGLFTRLDRAESTSETREGLRVTRNAIFR